MFRYLVCVFAGISLSVSLECFPEDCFASQSVTLPAYDAKTMTQYAATYQLIKSTNAKSLSGLGMALELETENLELPVWAYILSDSQVARYNTSNKDFSCSFSRIQDCIGFHGFLLSKRQTRFMFGQTFVTENKAMLVFQNNASTPLVLKYNYQIGTSEELADSCLVTALLPLRILFGSTTTFFLCFMSYLLFRTLTRKIRFVNQRTRRTQQQRTSMSNASDDQAGPSDPERTGLLADTDDTPHHTHTTDITSNNTDHTTDNNNNNNNNNTDTTTTTNNNNNNSPIVTTTKRGSRESIDITDEEMLVDDREKDACFGLVPHSHASFKEYYVCRGKFTWPFNPVPNEVLEQSERLFAFYAISSVGLLIQTVWVTQLRHNELMIGSANSFVKSVIARIGFSNVFSIFASVFVIYSLRMLKRENKAVQVCLQIALGLFLLYATSGLMRLLDTAPCTYVLFEFILPFVMSEVTHGILELAMYYALYKSFRSARQMTYRDVDVEEEVWKRKPRTPHTAT